MKKIEVVYDYQIFIRQRMGGISRVFYEVNKRLESRKDLRLSYPLIFSQNFYFQGKVHSSRLASVSAVINYSLRAINKTVFILFLLTHRKCDIVHPTYYSGYFYYILPHKTKYVLTVHDCIQELCANKSLGNARMCYLKKKAIKRADAIIVPSQNTKKDILSIYGIDEKKIYVVNWGAEKTFADKEKTDITLPNQYILYVGARNTYKNFDNFILAVAEICSDFAELKVVCIGGGNFSKTEKRFLDELHLSDRFIQLSTDDSGLMDAYRNALCFVYPSFYEGFGIPILEAFANECPVALSNASCFPEIGGNAASYFEPDDVRSMRECIWDLIRDQDLRKDLIEKGKNRAKLFSWEKAAEKTAEIYRYLVGSRVGSEDSIHKVS